MQRRRRLLYKWLQMTYFIIANAIQSLEEGGNKILVKNMFFFSFFESTYILIPTKDAIGEVSICLQQTLLTVHFFIVSFSFFPGNQVDSRKAETKQVYIISF